MAGARHVCRVRPLVQDNYWLHSLNKLACCCCKAACARLGAPTHMHMANTQLVVSLWSSVVPQAKQAFESRFLEAYYKAQLSTSSAIPRMM